MKKPAFFSRALTTTGEKFRLMYTGEIFTTTTTGALLTGTTTGAPENKIDLTDTHSQVKPLDIAQNALTATALHFITMQCYFAALSVCKSLRFVADSDDLKILTTFTAELTKSMRNFENGTFSNDETTGDGYNLFTVAYSEFFAQCNENDIAFIDRMSKGCNFSDSAKALVLRLDKRTVKSRKFKCKEYETKICSIWQAMTSAVRAEISAHSGFDFRRQKTVYFDILDIDSIRKYIALDIVTDNKDTDFTREIAYQNRYNALLSALTERQKTVLRYIQSGFGARVIAEKLNVRLYAAQKHIYAIRKVAAKVYGANAIEKATAKQIEIDTDIPVSIPIEFENATVYIPYAGNIMKYAFSENTQVFIPDIESQGDNTATTKPHFVAPKKRKFRIVSTAFSTEKECIHERLMYRYSDKLSALRYWKNA